MPVGGVGGNIDFSTINRGTIIEQSRRVSFVQSVLLKLITYHMLLSNRYKLALNICNYTTLASAGKCILN